MRPRDTGETLVREMGSIVLLLLLLAVPALVVAAALADRKLPQRDFRGWEATARELELPFAGRENERTLGGLLEGVPVRATYRRRTTNAGQRHSALETTTFYGGGIARIPKSLVVHRDTPLLSFTRFFGGKSEQTGDESFDDLVELPELDAYACAALSGPARRKLALLVKRGGEVRASTLTQELTDAGPALERAFLVQTLRFFADLARLLTVTRASLHQRLADNATTDRSHGVRLRNFQFLVAPETATPPALLAPTARRLLSDAHPPLRLAAARQLAREGSPVLQALASDSTCDVGLRLDALAALREQADPALARLIARLFLAPLPPELGCAALSAVATLQLNEVAATVVASTRDAEATVRAAAARALAALDVQPEHEAALVGLLADVAPDVQLASAEALGAIGSVIAVEPLLPLAQGFGRAQLRQTARAAIGRIQSRLGNAEAGSLSLAESPELLGAVELADASAALRIGAVSLTEPVSRVTSPEEPGSR